MFKKVIELWHPDSPGMRVRVVRGLLARLFLSKEFATLSETIRCSKFSAYKRNTIYGRMENQYFRNGFKAACSMLFGTAASTTYVRAALMISEHGPTVNARERYYDDGVKAALVMYEHLNLDDLKVRDLHDAIMHEGIL